MSSAESTQRFFRPADATRVRRNHRRIQLQRALVVARNLVFTFVVGLAALWAYRQTHSDARFAVRTIETAGAMHTPRAALERVTRSYVGANLFAIDIARVQRDLGSLAWIQRVAIEKKLPDTLRINVLERRPAALLQDASRLQYVDVEGVVLGELSPAVGDDDLPLIAAARGPELVRTVRFLTEIRRSDPPLYSRIGEIRPVPPRGFAVFDRELATTVYLNGEDAALKWRELHAIAGAEQLAAGSIEYADARFAGRIIVKPHPAFARSLVPVSRNNPVVEITN